MVYTTPQEVRDILGLEVDEATDTVLSDLIEKAQPVILHYIQVRVKDEVVALSGSSFSSAYRYIADTNYDKLVNTLDFSIWGWVKTDDPTTRVRLPVSTFHPDYGFFVLSSDPTGTYAAVSIDYSYYTCMVDWSLVGLATTYYVAMLWTAREMYLVPEDLVIGNVRARNRLKMPWERIRDDFLRVVNMITSVPMDVVSYQKMMVKSREKETLYGPGTSIQLEDESTGENVKDID